MENLPQISSILNQTQLRSQINTKQSTQNSQLIKPHTVSQHRNLSPFTWNNLKLPAVLLKNRLQKNSSHKKSDTLQKLSNTIDFAGMDIKMQIIKEKNMKIKQLLNPVTGQNNRPKVLSNQFSLHEKVIEQNQRARFTSQYEKRKLKMTINQQSLALKKQKFNCYGNEQNQNKIAAQIKRLNDVRYSLNTNQEYRLKKSVQKFQNDESSLNESISMNSSRNYSFQSPSNSAYHGMEPFMKNYFLKLSKLQNGQKYFVTSNPKYQPMQRSNEKSKDSTYQSFTKEEVKTLIWTKNPVQNIFKQKSPQQFYNHIEGSYVLTSKQKLHEIMHGGKGQSGIYYPLSFSLPDQYKDFVEQYDWTLVKMLLKLLVTEIKKFQAQFSIADQQKSDEIQEQQCDICLSDILDQLIRETRNEQQINLLKFALFLQNKIQKFHLNTFFESLPSYRQIQIKLTQNIHVDIIQWCIKTKQQLANQNLKIISFQTIDYRLLQLLKMYDKIFSQNLPHYLYKNLNIQKNMWIVKPFASSKAAGISIISQNPQFYTTRDFQYKQFRYKPKYQNKIIMKYITNPFLIKHSGIDYFAKKMIKQLASKFNSQQDDDEYIFKQIVQEINLKVGKFLKLQQKYCLRKFDIRQWVLIVCEQQPIQNEQKSDENNLVTMRKLRIHNKQKKRLKMYKYHTGYCRFAMKPYQLQTRDFEVHLTNYQLYKRQNSPIKSPRYPKKQENEPSSISYEKKNNLNSKRHTDESVLMLDQLFEYVDFMGQIKAKNKEINTQKTQKHIQTKSDKLKDKYEKQLDKILDKVLKNSYRHFTHNVNTYELFGFDLFFDQQMNLYLLQVNLNPGCATQRSLKLQSQAQKMLGSMLEIVTKNNFDTKEIQNSFVHSSQNINKTHQNGWIQVCSKDILF